MDNKFEIIRYNREMKDEWDTFVSCSRNSTFLFMRDYMDYHSDRFCDCSWVVRRKGRIVGLLPANITEDGILHSHQGLTYGGWILPLSHIDGEDVLVFFEESARMWRSMGIKGLDYKPLPYIYFLRPSQDDLYALFRLGGEVSEVNLSMAIDYVSPGSFDKLRKRTFLKTTRFSDKIVEMQDPDRMMDVISECLAERHGVSPVHTCDEMRILKSRFPENIRFFGIPSHRNDGMAAVVCIYDTGVVAHAQYIATTEEGRGENMLTPLFAYLIQELYSDRRFFDFGTSNEDNGMFLNSGLLRQKASFGASGVAYMRYSLVL